MSLETMTKLFSTTVGAGGTASVTFSNIPQNYTDLKLVISGRDDRSGQPNGDFAMQVGFNGTINTSSIYTSKRLGGNGSSAFSDGGTSTFISLGMLTSVTATANAFGSNELYINNYSSNVFKSLSCEGASENNATTAFMTMNTGLISTSAPITDIRIYSYFGTVLLQHTNITLYGIKNARQTAGNSIKATGGNISFDGTYVYHMFNSTGAFTPTQPIYADYLVVAGGGSGAGGYSTNAKGAGGGAGGYISSNTISGGGGAAQPMLSLSANPYTVTIGAGATGVSGGTSGGTQGTSSSLGGPSLTTITAVGGGGGATFSQVGTTGGSGGGGFSGAGYAGTTNQGYAGGLGLAYTGNTDGAGGSGGGAGSVGSPAMTPNIAGNGGSGLTWCSFVSVAGGGGGGSVANNGAATHGGGNGGSGNNSGSAASPNTGGGGGGGSSQPGFTSGGNGGSGVVIFRYKG